jgi:hypothetical protein
MINSNGNLTILVHVHYCAPSGFDNFEVHGGQYCCPICFEAPSGFNNFEVHLFWSTNRSRQYRYRSACPSLLSDLFWSSIRIWRLKIFHNISRFLRPFSHTFSFSRKFSLFSWAFFTKFSWKYENEIFVSTLTVPIHHRSYERRLLFFLSQ